MVHHGIGALAAVFLFAPTTAVECNLNLYYNQHLDLDLSEQFAMDCSSYVTRTCYNGGHTNEVLDAFVNDGIVDEVCYPYINDIGDCTFDYPAINRIYIDNYTACGGTYSVCNDNDLKEALITKGTMSANLGGHSMCLVGYGFVYPNMILDTDNSYGNITIDEFSPYVGQTYWVFKNSRTANDGHAGYVYTLRYDAGDPNFDLNWWKFYSVEIPIDSLNLIVPLCLDEDNDGYYNWGIGPKPCSCGEKVPDEPDCDDSNSFLGPFSEDFSCSVNCTEFIYNTTDCVILYDTAFIDVTYINQDLIIEDNVDLYIYGELLLHDDVNIYISNGASLILTENSIVKGVCDDIYFSGTIIVAPGGEIVFEKNSTAYFNGDGEISIQHGGTLDGAMEFYQGVNLVLNDNDTRIDISGVLNIHDNATFTFSGNGYIKFSNPGDDATNNIFCGTGASMLFSGSGQNDKVLEIDQSTVRFPAMSSLTFENCKIEMAASKRMLSDGNNPITFNNVKMTSTTGAYNAHRSFHFYGQEDITVINSTFEYGYYGLYANMTYTAGATMTFNNCTFQNNYYGIQAYGKGVHLYDCTVLNNTYYGLYCTAMSLPSNITTSSINSNQSGMYYQGSSSSDIDVDFSNFVGNSSRGVYTSGNFDLDMSCNLISNNTYGIYTRYGTNLRIDQNSKNEIVDNSKSIYLNYGSLFANNGYNQLYAANSGYAVYGQTSLLFQPYQIYANHNRWEDSNPNAAPTYDVNYKLWIYNSPPTPNLTVEIVDNYRGYATCPGLILPGIGLQMDGLAMTSANNEESEILPDIAIQVQALALQSENLVNATDFEDLMNQYCSLISNNDINNNAESEYWQYIAYSDAHKLINKLYEKAEQNIENEQLNSMINKLIDLNNTLSENIESPYSRYVEYQLDNALLERFRNNLNTAVISLNDLKNEIIFTEYTDELENIDIWLCYLGNEKLAQQGLLNPDEFLIATENCDKCNSTEFSEIENKNSNSSAPSEKEEIGNIEQNNMSSNIITIKPNPSNGSFNINVNTNCTNCEIIIYNAIGQEVRKYKHSSESSNDIFVSGLTKGQYSIVIIDGKQLIDTEKIVVN